jgi:hypothetical protein
MAGSADIKAGGAFVELSTKDAKFQSGLKTAEQRFKTFGTALMGVGASLVGSGVGWGMTLYHLAQHAAEAGASLYEMSERTGLSVESLSQFKHAAGQSGLAMEDFETAVKKMQKAIASNDSQKMFAKLGLSLGELRKMDPHEQLVMIASAFGRISNPAMKTGAALELFGKAGTRMIPMLSEGAEGLQEMLEEAEKLGLVMSGDDAEGAHRMHQQMKTLAEITERAKVVIGTGFIPVLVALNNLDIKSHGNWLKILQDHKALVVSFGMATVATIALGAAIATAGAVSWVFGGALGYLKLAFTGVVAAVKLTWAGLVALYAIMAANPIAFLVVALGAVAAAAMLSSRTVRTSMRGSFDGLKEDAISSFKGIQNALASGDLALAGSIGMSLLQVEWIRTCAAMSTTWHETIAGFAIAWMNFEALWKKGDLNFSAWLAKQGKNAGSMWDDITSQIELAAIAAKEATGLITAEEAAKQVAEVKRSQAMGEISRKAFNEAVDREARRRGTGIDEDAQEVKDRIAADAQKKIDAATKELEDERAKLKAINAQPPVPAVPGKGHGGPGVDPESGKFGASGTFDAGIINRLYGTAARGCESKPRRRRAEESSRRRQATTRHAEAH